MTQLNAQTELKKELHSFIDRISYQRLQALKPILVDLTKPDYIIETDLTDAEHTLIAESMQEYEADPSSFITLEDYKKTRTLG